MANEQPEALYGRMKALTATMPDMKFERLGYQQRLTPEFQLWTARSLTLVKEALGVGAEVRFEIAKQKLGGNYHESAVLEIVSLLYNTLAHLERALPAAAQGAFIPAGNTFDAMSAVGKIVGAATKTFSSLTHIWTLNFSQTLRASFRNQFHCGC